MTAQFQFNFQCDASKATANVRKHYVSLEQAKSVFHDSQAISIPDHGHSVAEERWITLGLDAQGWPLIISHTWRENKEAAACKATKSDAQQYRSKNA